MRKVTLMLMLLAGLLPACTRSSFINAGERWRDSLCREKYGQDCQDPGDVCRGPPDHNNPVDVPFGRVS